MLCFSVRCMPTLACICVLDVFIYYTLEKMVNTDLKMYVIRMLLASTQHMDKNLWLHSAIMLNKESFDEIATSSSC